MELESILLCETTEVQKDKTTCFSYLHSDF